MKFSIKDFFSKCKQVSEKSKQQIYYNFKNVILHAKILPHLPHFGQNKNLP